MIFWSLTGLTLYLFAQLFFGTYATSRWGVQRVTHLIVAITLGPLMLIALIGSQVQSRTLLRQFR
ncbi:hypothetical protein HGP28_01300 [Vibrio sp. SM6]|uniref:Uncharacterized protein n=1 Tax=Vibrio agarilyticus TaxID=2726741 RepID=A0A7X8TMY5_9VIBR|nr:hypothetical protein [Vibrio agarilyticus]NLS11524.1 hypothetical protein [Vibrio agarilyticus]